MVIKHGHRYCRWYGKFCTEHQLYGYDMDNFIKQLTLELTKECGVPIVVEWNWRDSPGVIQFEVSDEIGTMFLMKWN